MPATARAALQVAGLAALVGGGVALGRGVVGMSGSHPAPPEFASAAAPDVLPTPIQFAPPVAVTEAEPVFTSSLRSWVSPRGDATVPGLDAPASSEPMASPTPIEPPTTYTVTSGDTLSQIADRFGIGTVALEQTNALQDPNVLVPGSRLTIPTPNQQTAALSPTASPSGQPALASVPTGAQPQPQSTGIRTASGGAPVAAAVGGANPSDAVRTFYNLVDQGRFDEAAELWSPRMRSSYPPAENINSRFARTQALTLSRAEVIQFDAAGGHATVAVALSEVVSPPTSTRTYVGYWYLVRGATGWLLDQPGLHPG